ncbi:MAG TPA: UDP-N-acetylglucosamine 1-carboxyvinyltransferase [Candidatus Angelobacter sp.]|nr:UDP-N-acetylglucosamine 1-carboxyvinyltransferase [Candidatus Angelobacter sp.]
MDRIRIRGGRRLQGEIQISGAKNAALPLMAAALLTTEPLRLANVPDLVDIATMASLLSQLGATISVVEPAAGAASAIRGMLLQASDITDTTAPYDLVRKMRASVLVLGPLVARCGEAKVSLPGGCAIGTRPVDLHLKGLAQLGAEIELQDGYVFAKAPKGLVGGRVVFPNVSVGATENIMMAAALARGETEIVNAAREPEIVDLAHCLTAMGADIRGIGTDTLHIRGVERLHGADHAVIPDRIETGTYAMAAAITDGDIELIGARLDQLEAVAQTLTQARVTVAPTARGLRVGRINGELTGVDVMTEPFPGFPTDLQAQFMALMTAATGAAMITETIFENRFMHVPELCRMGASINVHGASAMVRGVKRLTGAPVMATDLRASVSLVLAGLAADGDTILNRVYHLDRGYERLVDKLGACGAEIERLK